jgi:hypothetical protein
MSERILNLQRWLRAHGSDVTVDGAWGPITRKAVIETFRNRQATAITEDEIRALANRHQFDERAMKAVAKVESAGGGWDNTGLLKCLYERHYLFRRIGKAFGVLSSPTGGGYTIDANKDGVNDSWEKLADATGLFSFNTAFECASFGKFQIMGAHWKALGYPSVAEFVWGMSRSEAAHYEAFARFVVVNGLTDALNACDGDPANCLAFARGYNGKGQKGYDQRIAAAWKVAA